MDIAQLKEGNIINNRIEYKRSKTGVELLGKNVELVHLAEEYPITKKEHGVDFLMEHRHLWLRSKKQVAIMRIRDKLIKAIRDYFDKEDFVLVDTPIFTPSSCEGTTNLFEVDYYDTKAYLTQSGQLYSEATAMALGKVYCFGPTFRAEKSKTRRHLLEFWMMEPEIAYADLDEVINVAEDMMCYIIEKVLETCRPYFEILERDISKLESIKNPFPRITYTEAVEILHKNNIEFEWGNDFGAPDETLISSQFDLPLFVTHYPAGCKAFYMKRPEKDSEVSCSVDLLAPEGYGEIIGGGQREDDYDILLASIKKHNLPEEAFKWYLDLRKYGSVPHGGFGLGIERTVAWICGVHHIRECIPFPRVLGRIYP